MKKPLQPYYESPVTTPLVELELGMTDDLLCALTLFAALGCGLIGGLFYAFSTFVMKALARLSPASGIAAMQAINVVIINPWFLGVFFGTALICLVLAVSSFSIWQEPKAVFLLTGSLLYLIGSIVVTMIFNVPRNNALAAVNPESAEGARLWTNYVAIWTAWNHVRTAASLAAAAALMIGLR